MKCLTKILPLVAVIGLIAACGGGSSGGGTSLNSVSDLPSMDAQNYDYSYAGATGQSINLGKAVEPGQPGGFSRSGCEAYQIKQQVIRQSKQPEMIKCYVGALESLAGLTIPTGSWGVYTITDFPEGAGPTEVEEGGSFLVRIRKTSGGGLDMDSCFGTASKNMEMRSTVNSDGGCTITMMDKHDSFGSFSMTGTLTEACSTSSYGTATFTMNFSDSFGYGSSSLTADRTNVINTVSGAMHGIWQGNSFDGRIYSKFGQEKGSAKYHANGTYPAWTVSQSCGGNQDCINWISGQFGFVSGDYVCWQETDGSWAPTGATDPDGDGTLNCTFDENGAEGFDITTSGNLQNFLVATDSTAAGYYYADVDQTLADPENPTIEFTDSWDCDATGAVELNVSQLYSGGTPAQQAAFATCVALEASMNDFQQDSLCQALEEAARAEFDAENQSGLDLTQFTYNIADDTTCANTTDTATITADGTTYTTSDIGTGDGDQLIQFTFNGSDCSNASLIDPPLDFVSCSVNINTGVITFSGLGVEIPCDIVLTPQ